jgi:hypothetical protein
MKKFLLVLSLLMIFVIGCGRQKGFDLSKSEQFLKWSFVKSPASGVCYEMMTMDFDLFIIHNTYSGMSRVDDKYCDKSASSN